MNTNPTLVIVVGFAYALQYVEKFFSFKTEGIKRAHLFSFDSELRNRYLGNLMSLARDVAPPDESFLSRSICEYIKDPVPRREQFFLVCTEFFSSSRTFGEGNEGVFDYSILSQQGITLGAEIYRDYPSFFGELVKSVCLRQTSGNPDLSCGIIFTSRE